MAVLKEKMDKADEHFRIRYFFFLKELQDKKPKGKTLEFNIDPTSYASEDTTSYLSSKGIRGFGRRSFWTPENYVFGSNLSYQGITESLRCLQEEIDKHEIKVDWNNIEHLSIAAENDPKFRKTIENLKREAEL